MKILIPGHKEKVKKYKEFTCRDCGCVFLADQTEYTNVSDQNGSDVYADCPCCETRIHNYTTEFVVCIDEVTKPKPFGNTRNSTDKQINSK